MKPGETMRQALEALEPHLRPLCLRDLEAQAKREGNLEVLREIKAYKAIEASRPILSLISTKEPPPEDLLVLARRPCVTCFAATWRPARRPSPMFRFPAGCSSPA